MVNAQKPARTPDSLCKPRLFNRPSPSRLFALLSACNRSMARSTFMPVHLLLPVSAKRRVLAFLHDRIIGLDYHAEHAMASMACLASCRRMPIAHAMQG